VRSGFKGGGGPERFTARRWFTLIMAGYQELVKISAFPPRCGIKTENALGRELEGGEHGYLSLSVGSTRQRLTGRPSSLLNGKVAHPSFRALFRGGWNEKRVDTRS
jgi:hypothetical protein